MDIISHGLWGGIAVGRKNKKSFWLAFLFGVAPDLFSFGIFFLARLAGFYGEVHWGGRPDADIVPSFVSCLYNFTHSLVIFAAVFFLLWLLNRRPIWEVCAWGLHIVLDIFTHSYSFFPTPFLWPVSDLKFDGRSWGDPIIFIPNISLLLILYVGFFVYRRYR